MVNPKKEEKVVKVDSVVLEFSNLEKGISTLKKELDSLILDKKTNEKDMALTKDTILKLVLSYEKKVKEKEEEINNEKKNLYLISKDYEEKLKKKDEEIKKIILSSEDNPIILKELENIGISKEIIFLKKSELCKLLDSTINDNKEILKKYDLIVNENKKLKQEVNISIESYSKKIDELSIELKNVIIEKRDFEKKNINYSNEINEFKKKILSLIDSYDKNIVLLKKENEKRIAEIVNDYAKKDIEYKTNIIMLEKQIEDYKKVLFDSKNNREELLKIIEERIKRSISPVVLDAIIKRENIEKKN